MEENALLTIGSSATATICVAGPDLATTLDHGSEDAFPAVLATARMIALVELAASRAMRPLLGDGELETIAAARWTRVDGPQRLKRRSRS
jgi:predicted thioesterase